MSQPKKRDQGTEYTWRIQQIASMIASGEELDTASAQWESFITEQARGGAEIDVSALLQHVLRESYLENTRDLQHFADKVAYFNEMKQKIREQLQHLRSVREDIEAQIQSLSALSENIQEQIEALEDRLYSAGDDAQLANVELQNAIQKQQQSMQMMSNIMKSMHDTAKAIIQNMKG